MGAPGAVFESTSAAQYCCGGHQPVNAQELMAKAYRALASAQTLLQDGDNDGACNRARYAMFDAARAAPIASVAPGPLTGPKTHSGLIAAFSLHLVKPDRFPT